TGFFKLVQYGLEQCRIGILEPDTAAGRSRRHQVRPGFDAVGHYAVTASAQTLDAVDDDRVSAGAGDFCTHRIQEVRQVDDFRFARRVFQHASAICQRSGHHDVFSTGNADDIEEEVRTAQATGRCLGLDIPAFDVDL